MSLTFKCAICDASFSPGVLDKQGKALEKAREVRAAKSNEDNS